MPAARSAHTTCAMYTCIPYNFERFPLHEAKRATSPPHCISTEILFLLIYYIIRIMPGNQILREAADDPKVWKRSGNELFNRGLYKIALKFYAKAIELNPGFIEAWNNLGLSFLKIGKIEEARMCNAKVKELKQRSGLSHKIISNPAVHKKRHVHSNTLSESRSLINDNFWYAFCVAILMGISLTILILPHALTRTIHTLGLIWGASVVWFVLLYLLLQYVFHRAV